MYIGQKQNHICDMQRNPIFAKVNLKTNIKTQRMNWVVFGYKEHESNDFAILFFGGNRETIKIFFRNSFSLFGWIKIPFVLAQVA